jgi:Mg2+ and Co2+ transporter CorA
MNVRVPGEQTSEGFYAIVVVMIVLLGAMLGFFRRRGWL